MTYAYPDQIAAKAARIAAGHAPRILDLFGGGGLFAESARQAGGEIIGGLDNCPIAARTHAANHGHDAAPCDLTAADPFAIAARYDADVILASPSCQPHSRIGRAKLAAVAGARDAYLTDDRADLHRLIAPIAAAVRPLAVAVENVPDAKRTFPQIASDLDGLGYAVRWTILNAAWFGQPQVRQRLFLIAAHRSLRITPRFPDPTHFHQMTAGYRAVESMSRSDCAHFVAPTRPSRHLPRTPTVSDAIGDLPSLDGCRLPAPPSPYAAALCGVLPLHDHIGRVPSERDRRIFGLMESGDDYRHANMIAVRLLHEEIARRGLTDIAEIDALRKDYCPPYDPAKFRDAWRRLDGSKPSHVLTAHLAHDTYSAIHYAEARTLTVREVARLQGVPDDFLLTASGASMSASFRMLGNGVGIHAGRAVAAALIAQIRQAVRAPVVAASRDRFRVMADRRFLPRSSAVAFAAHPDLWASPQAYADAKADRREAGIPDIADADAERMGLVLTPCKVGWMRRGFDAWIGRERLPTLAAYLDDLDGTPYAEWEARRRRKPDMAAAE